MNVGGALAAPLRGRIPDGVPPRSTQKLQSAALYEVAVELLAARSLTEAELRGRLSKRAASEQALNDTVARLQEAGYLSDQQAAESHAYRRRELEAVGPERAYVELRRRGVEEAVSRRAVESAYAEIDQLDLIERRLRRSGNLDRLRGDPKGLLRLVRGLARAGFRSDKIVEALRRRGFAAEWLDEAAEAETEAQLPSDSEIG